MEFSFVIIGYFDTLSMLYELFITWFGNLGQRDVSGLASDVLKGIWKTKMLKTGYRGAFTLVLLVLFSYMGLEPGQCFKFKVISRVPFPCDMTYE